MTKHECHEAYAIEQKPRPYLTANVVLFSEGQGQILLAKSKGQEFDGGWALPCCFANPNETVGETALIALKEDFGLDDAALRLEEVGLFSEPGRDPRGWVVSEAYMACVKKNDVVLQNGNNAWHAEWFQIVYERNADYSRFYLVSDNTKLSINGDSSDLVFDHSKIINEALKRYMQKRKEWIYE